MFDKWYNLKDAKPEFKHDGDNSYLSNKLLLLIDGYLRTGYYLDWINVDDNNKHYISLELDRYSFCSIYFLGLEPCNKLENNFGYQEIDDIYEEDFKDHEIFWCEVDIKELEKGVNHEIKTNRRIKG